MDRAAALKARFEESKSRSRNRSLEREKDVERRRAEYLKKAKVQAKGRCAHAHLARSTTAGRDEKSEPLQ